MIVIRPVIKPKPAQGEGAGQYREEAVVYSS